MKMFSVTGKSERIIQTDLGADLELSRSIVSSQSHVI